MTWNFPSHGFLFSFFISVMSPPALLLSLLNLSDQLHFLQIFSFVVRSFRLIQAKMVYDARETKIMANCRLCPRLMLALLGTDN